MDAYRTMWDYPATSIQTSVHRGTTVLSPPGRFPTLLLVLGRTGTDNTFERLTLSPTFFFKNEIRIFYTTLSFLVLFGVSVTTKITNTTCGDHITASQVDAFGEMSGLFSVHVGHLKHLHQICHNIRASHFKRVSYQITRFRQPTVKLRACHVVS